MNTSKFVVCQIQVGSFKRSVIYRSETFKTLMGAREGIANLVAYRYFDANDFDNFDHGLPVNF